MRFPTKAALILATAFVSISTPFIADWEKLETKPYLDAVKVKTVCYGETNVPMREYSPEECAAMLDKRVKSIGAFVDRQVSVPLTPSRKAALVSFTYNVGEGAFARSTLLKKLNRGDVKGACDELLKWTYAKGKKLKGLERRRIAERELCLK